MLTLANSSYGGRRLFAGHQTQTAPFTIDIPASPTTATYHGDSGAINREIGDGETIAVNFPVMTSSCQSSRR